MRVGFLLLSQRLQSAKSGGQWLLVRLQGAVKACLNYSPASPVHEDFGRDAAAALRAAAARRAPHATGELSDRERHARMEHHMREAAIEAKRNPVADPTKAVASAHVRRTALMLSFVPTAGAGGDRLKTLLAPLVRVLDGVYSRPVLLLPTYYFRVAHLRLRRARALSMMNTYISMLNLHCLGD